MSDIKWIKVTVDMFEDSKIEFLRSLPEGDSIIVIWLQMLSIAGKSNANGYLMITDGIPYTEQLLCNTLRRNPVLMQFAVETFIRLKMINIEDGPFHITRWEKHQNLEQMGKIKSDGAIRQARYRENQKNKLLLEQENDESDVTNDVTSDVTKSHSNEQEVRSKNKELKHIVDSNECDDSFEQWYSVYPKQGSVRKKAHESWKTLWKDKKIDMIKLMEGTHAYIAYQKHNQYKTCGAQVFLNQQRWNDDGWIIQKDSERDYKPTNKKAAQLQVITTTEDKELIEHVYGNRNRPESIPTAINK